MGKMKICKNKFFLKGLAVGIILLFITTSISSINARCLSYKCNVEEECPNLMINTNSLTVHININPNTTVYEGDIIECNITGNPTTKYWKINDQNKHTIFHEDNPVIFDTEPTPLNEEYVNLTVCVENDNGTACDTARIKVKRLFFGDLQFHSTISDGYHPPDALYQNAIDDNYLDFACLTDHAEIINEIDWTPPQPIWMRLRTFLQFLGYKFLGRDEWQTIKDLTQEYYDPGNFTTLLGFEYSPGPWSPGGFAFGPNGYEDVSHLCFYYKEVYPAAPEYSAYDMHTFDDIFLVMEEERNKGHLNICFPHHPLMRIGKWGDYSVNWTFLANGLQNTDARNKLLRGVETYSKWGSAIGKYSEIPIRWPYDPKDCCDHPDYWVENGLWEWSKPEMNGQRFVLMASSDNHAVDRPGSASMESRVSKNHPNPSGIVAAYSVHNTRDEIWDALNNCTIYGSQVLKIRANVRFDGQMAPGRWINCTSPLKIQVSAFSTFPGPDRGGNRMNPHGYSADELDYPISDIWLIKKDRDKGQPWCKVIHHVTPETNLSIVEFEDFDVQPNDFYYVAIRQNGQLLEDPGNTDNATRDEYMAFFGPVFIDSVQKV